MNEPGLVVDASAVIALLVGEPFTRFDPERVARASISAVNLAEVLTRLHEIGMPEAEAAEAAARLDLQIVAFDESQARAAARLRRSTRQAGLSLGDRACLALGQSLECSVVTADRVWARLRIGIEIVLIR